MNINQSLKSNPHVQSSSLRTILIDISILCKLVEPVILSQQKQNHWVMPLWNRLMMFHLIYSKILLLMILCMKFGFVKMFLEKKNWKNLYL